MPLKYMSTASGYVQARSHFSLVEAATMFKVRKVRPKMKMRKIPGVILDHKKRYYPGVKSADQLFFDPRPRVTLVTPNASSFMGRSFRSRIGTSRLPPPWPIWNILLRSTTNGTSAQPIAHPTSGYSARFMETLRNASKTMRWSFLAPAISDPFKSQRDPRGPTTESKSIRDWSTLSNRSTAELKANPRKQFRTSEGKETQRSR